MKAREVDRWFATERVPAPESLKRVAWLDDLRRAFEDGTRPPTRLLDDGRTPSMLSADERMLLYWLGRHWWSGRGQVVDLGTYFGGSTACLALGLADGGRAAAHGDAPPVVGFDRGRFGPLEGHEGASGRRFGSWAEGSSFPIERTLTGLRHLVEIRLGEIEEAVWDRDQRIELLHIDIAKSERIGRAVTRTFFPALLPGSILIQQDFFFDRLPWIKTFQARLSGHFILVGQVASSAVFLCVDPPTDTEVQRAVAPSSSGADGHAEFARPGLATHRLRALEISAAYTVAASGRRIRALLRLRGIRRRYGTLPAEDHVGGVDRIGRAMRSIISGDHAHGIQRLPRGVRQVARWLAGDPQRRHLSV